MAREWWFEDITRTDVFGTVPLTVWCLHLSSFFASIFPLFPRNAWYSGYITFEIQRIVWEFELAPPPPAPKPWGRKHNSIIPPHNSPLYWIYDMYMSTYTTSTSAMAREWWFEDITRTDVFGTVPLTVWCLRILEDRFYNTSSPSGKYQHPALLHNRSKYKGLYGEKTNVYANL